MTPHLQSSSVGEFRQLPVLIFAIGEVAADDEGNTALIELTLSKFVWVTLSGLRGNHQRGVLGDLKGTST